MCGWRHLFKMKTILALCLLSFACGCKNTVTTNKDGSITVQTFNDGATLTIVTNKGHIFAVLTGGRGCAMAEIKEDK